MSSDEAGVFGRYLLGRQIDAKSRAQYDRALRRLSYDTNDPTASFAIRHPWSIAALDGALALTEPAALLRKKLLLMTAILETRPEYCDAFLSRDRAPSDALSIACTLALAGLLAVAGLLLLRFVR